MRFHTRSLEVRTPYYNWGKTVWGLSSLVVPLWRWPSGPLTPEAAPEATFSPLFLMLCNRDFEVSCAHEMHTNVLIYITAHWRERDLKLDYSSIRAT